MNPCVVTPTYQESDNIETFLRQVREALPDAHILIVDDSSPDGTADKAEKLHDELGNITVMRRPAKSGLGSAYRDGFAWALDRGYDRIVEMDADLSHQPSALPSLVAASEDVALVIGSRYVPGGHIPEWPWHRRMLSQWGNRYVGLVLGVGIRDATSGYRVFAAETIRNANVTGTNADGYAFQIEVAYRVARTGGTIVEYPITFIDRTLGKSKMSGTIIVEALLLVTWWAVRDRILGPLRRK